MLKSLIALPYQVVVGLGILLVVVYFQYSYDLSGEYLKQGDRHYAGQKYEFAVQNYEQALKYNDDDADIYFKLGKGEAATADPIGAASAFTKALELEYDYPGNAYVGLGWAQYGLVQYDAAAESFNQAVEIITADEQRYSPEQLAEAYSGLGWVAMVQEGCEAANAYFEQGLALAPDVASLVRGSEQCP